MRISFRISLLNHGLSLFRIVIIFVGIHSCAILRTLKIRYMPVFCLFALGRHSNFTAGGTMEQPDLLCTALALNIEFLKIYIWGSPVRTQSHTFH
jgi:hypothetical protein